jgi:Na+/melibiose symporter-like transporter
LIGKTALALAAAAMIAAAAALFVWAAGFALFSWLDQPLGDAGAAGVVAASALAFILLVFGLANLRKEIKEEQKREAFPSPAHSLIMQFGETIKDRPLLTLGLTALTGLAATRDPNLLKDLWSAVLSHSKRDDD